MVKERQRTTRKDNRGRIFKKGEGQDKDGRYYYVYTDASGKRKRIYNTDLISLRENEQRIQKDLEDGIDISAANRTLNEQFDLYLSTKDIRQSSLAHYREYWNRCVKNDIGKRRVTDIKKADLQVFYKKLSDKGYADSTIRQFGVSMIMPTLEMALENDIIRKNPAKGCMKEYNGKVKTREALTVAEQQALMNFIEKSECYKIYLPLFTVMFSTACRRGEIIGLTWNDVDLKNKTISINHQLLYKDYGDGFKFHYSEPKTETGNRIIPMTPKCYKALIKQREQQFVLGIARDIEIEGLSNFVFTTLKGTPYIPANINNLLKKIVTQYNQNETMCAKREKREPRLLPHITCHSFRHTGCTRLAEGHIDIKTLQEFMGHSDIKVTMNVYNHVDNERMAKEVIQAVSNSNVM